jgi:hypothetical protein
MSGDLLTSTIVVLARVDVLWLAGGVVGLLMVGAIGRVVIAATGAGRRRRSGFAQPDALQGGLPTGTQPAGGR